jgi:hypothetical protein
MMVGRVSAKWNNLDDKSSMVFTDSTLSITVVYEIFVPKPPVTIRLAQNPLNHYIATQPNLASLIASHS